MNDASDRTLHILRCTIRSELGRDEVDLTLRQLGIFLVVYQAAELQTVRGLAKTLFIGRSIVTRSLHRLSDEDLIRRSRDPADGRSILITRTERGSAMMRRLGRAMATAAQTF